MTALLDAGSCVNGHQLPPFRLETLLGEDGEPVQAWVTECRAPMRVILDGRHIVAECATRVTAELVAPEPGKPAADFAGAVIIEWPTAATAGVGVLPGYKARIYDASTGESPEPRQMTTVLRIAVSASLDEIVTADLTMLAAEDGTPLREGDPVIRDGEILTGIFPFIVAEMRIRQ